MPGLAVVKIPEEGFKFDQAFFDIEKKAEKIEEESGALKRIVTGFAAVADVVDSQYEVITREALEAAAKDLLQYTTVLYNHDPNRPIGKVLEAQPKGEGLFVKVLVSASEDEIWNKITEGIISKFSFRGTVTDFEEKYDKQLQKYITVIKGFRIFEVSLVSVPANPHAKTLHHYLSKALESVETVSKETPKTQENEPKGGLLKAMDKEKAKFIAGLVDKLMAALQDMPHKVDERLLAICRKIKSEVMQATAGEENPYPQPSPEDKDLEGYDPVMEGFKSRIASFEEKMAGLEKRLDEIGPTLEEKLVEGIKSIAETMVTDKIGDIEKELGSQAEVISSFIELLDALRPQLGLPVIEKEQETETSEEKTEGGES
jgi:HK97 family phage prohead protease